MNKTEKKNKCKGILNSGSDIVRDKEDFEFLCEIFKEHDEYELKIKGQKIIKISIKKSSHGSKCFYITREDGTETDISYVSCLDSKKNKKLKDIRSACRETIVPLILKEREKLQFPFKCPLSGVIINSIKDVHIDHYDLDFKDVADLWIKENGGIENIYKYVCETKDNETVTYFTEENIKENFIKFHNEHTHLRAIYKRENLSTRKRKKESESLQYEQNRK